MERRAATQRRLCRHDCVQLRLGLPQEGVQAVGRYEAKVQVKGRYEAKRVIEGGATEHGGVAGKCAVALLLLALPLELVGERGDLSCRRARRG